MRSRIGMKLFRLTVLLGGILWFLPDGLSWKGFWF